jgi:hypothetical protein
VLVAEPAGRQLKKVMEDSSLYAWSFHVDWKNPSKTKVVGPTRIAVAPYHYLCDGQLTNCVPQPGVDRRLDAQGDKIMARLVYRRIGNRESVVAVHSVNTSAGGGGDFPEAPDAAFEVLNQFAWRTADDVARLAFWVADAPHHDQNAAALAQGIRTARGLGLHVYPVASSGIDVHGDGARRGEGGRELLLRTIRIGGGHDDSIWYVELLKKDAGISTRIRSVSNRGVRRGRDGD